MYKCNYVEYFLCWKYFVMVYFIYLIFEIDVKARYCFVYTKHCNSRAVGGLRFRNEE